MTTNPQKMNKERVRKIISLNPDAKLYFFSKADERWLDWLWENNFLDEIKTAAKDTSRYSYRTPEITYLSRLAEKVPGRVVDIMLDPDTATTRDKCKPELIDQFLGICRSLPADQLARVIPKIRLQGWVGLMGGNGHWGFQYEKMFKTLLAAKDYGSVILLAESVCSIRSNEITKPAKSIDNENPFYFERLHDTGVFEAVLAIPIEHLEDSLKFVNKIMAEIVLLGGETEGVGQTFSIRDSFPFYGIDFFTLEPGATENHSYRDDVKELAGVVKTLFQKAIDLKCRKDVETLDIYEKYIDSLPDSRAMWGLRLYVLSLCPSAFSQELKTAFFRLFDSKHYYEVTSGTEYEKALQKCFGILADSDQRDFVSKAIDYFGKKERDANEKESYVHAGSDIFSVIEGHLTDGERKEISEFGFEINAAYEPKPSYSSGGAGWVQSQGPISQEEFGKQPIEAIAQYLRADWSPRSIHDRYKQTDDFLTPHNAEGTGNLLKGDISNRLQEYVTHAEMFFERDVLDQHYTYSFLRGIEEAIKSNRQRAVESNWDKLIEMLISIKVSNESKPFDTANRERDEFGSWLSGWKSIFSAISDVIQALLNGENGKIIVDFPKHRDQIFTMISHLLNYPDPNPSNEDPKKPMMSSNRGGGSEQLASDPFTMAINTVRGRAFQTFATFIYPDGQELPKGAKIKLDAKELYERVLLKEDTRALMFMFGHYLPQFYFREIPWMQKLLPKIFPTDRSKSHLFLAAWEGYLSNNLYMDFLKDPNIEGLYYRGLTIAEIKETSRQYFKDPDEGLATHLALAFMHYPNFTFDHPLFVAFWKKGNVSQHQEFVSFLGRGFVSGENVQTKKYLAGNPGAREQLKEFWQWTLANQSESELFEKFGHWIDLGKSLFEPAWLAERVRKTLEKTKGKLDWDYGLNKNALQLAQNAPADTLVISRLMFLDGGIRINQQRRLFDFDQDWIEVFRVLYENPDTKDGTYKLINDLILEGGSLFWGLKSIIEKKNV